MNKYIAVILLVLVMTGCSRQPVSATITDYGTYDAIIVVKGTWKLGFPVAIDSVENLNHKDTKMKIPAKDGVYWGYRATVFNASTDKPVEISMVITHPLITSPDGKSSTEDKSYVSTLNPTQTVELQNMWFFIDSCPYEFVPGTWTLKVLADGKPVAVKSFEVYTP